MLRCPNCLAEFSGDYCSCCGQRRIRPEDLSARHFVGEVADELTSLHSTFKILRSVRALLVPGSLTAAYLGGRRQAYLTPIKLYLLCAAIFFLAAPLAGFSLAGMIASDPTGALDQQVIARMTTTGLDRPTLANRFDLRVQSVYTISLGAGALVIALLLQVLFRQSGLPYGAHLIFALHYVSFLYLVTIAAGLGLVASGSKDVVGILALAVVGPYVVLALKRVYSEPTMRGIVKGAAVIVLTLAVNNIASIAAIRLTFALL